MSDWSNASRKLKMNVKFEKWTQKGKTKSLHDKKKRFQVHNGSSPQNVMKIYKWMKLSGRNNNTQYKN